MGVTRNSLLLLLCLYSNAVFASSVRSSGDTYVAPTCDDGFYCPGYVYGYSCRPRSNRCTGDESDPECDQKTYQHCNYNSATGKFRVYRYATPLSSSGSISRSVTGDLNCLNYRLEHHFVTYRGLMYEFGRYKTKNGDPIGTRVQDPNDPKYEYRRGNRRWYGKTSLGESTCTYGQVVEFLTMWDKHKYKLCSRNCQDFAIGLGNHLKKGCPNLRNRNLRSDDDSDLDYLLQISANGTCASSSGTSPAMPLQFVSIAIVVGAIAAAII